MQLILLVFIFAFTVFAAHAEQAPVNSRGHAWPESSRGEAFPDEGPRYRVTRGHGHHRTHHAQGPARPAQRHGRVESIGRRAEPEYASHRH
jgi:hypothetical protein